MDALVLPVPHRDRGANDEEQVRFRGVFFRVAPAMFIGTLDQAIVAAALPTIAADLGDFARISWLVTAYLLAATVAAPIYGRLGDAFGRKRALLAALVFFLAGSIACALASTFIFLVAARVLQGLGGGGLMTLAQALIGEAVSPKERGRFQGWFGAIFALASTLGPLAGGLLSEHFGWRSIFWVNIPLAVIAAAVALRLRAAPGQGGFSPDLRGTPIFIMATVSLLLSLSLGPSRGWSSPSVLLSIALALIGFATLRSVERRSSDPLIPPDVVSLPVVWRSAACVLLFGALLFAMIVEIPVLLQVGCGIGAGASGFLLLPLTLAQVASSTMAGARISRTGHPRGPMVFGLSVAAIGLACLTEAAALGPAFTSIASVAVGAGIGVTMPAAQTMVQWAAGSGRLGTATAILSFSRSIGGVFGAALSSAILLVALRILAPATAAHALAPSAGTDLIAGHVPSIEFRTAFRWVFAGLAVLAGVAVLIARSISDVDLSQPTPVNARRPQNLYVAQNAP